MSVGMGLSYDLHIHSCLSPCGDADMTPGNIVGMAKVKGLDVIAVTDHNSCKNCPAVMKFAEEYGILAISGMELTTMEEVHVLCLFPDVDAAMAFDEMVYKRLLPVPNQEDIFGRQEIYDATDSCVGTVPNLLINATDITFDDAYGVVAEYGGVMVPAHIDKKTNSLLSNLGGFEEPPRHSTGESIHQAMQNNYQFGRTLLGAHPRTPPLPPCEGAECAGGVARITGVSCEGATTPPYVGIYRLSWLVSWV